MRLLREDESTIEPVSEQRLRSFLGRKRGGDTTFAILEDEDGSYVQMFGGTHAWGQP